MHPDENDDRDEEVEGAVRRFRRRDQIVEPVDIKETVENSTQTETIGKESSMSRIGLLE